VHLVQNSEGWSKNALAGEFGIDRRAIDKILKTIRPSGKKSGHPVWLLRDVVVPIARYISEEIDFDEGDFDPEKLPPKKRKDWFDSEVQRLKYEEQMGRLIPADEIAKVEAEKNKKIALHLETMTDVIERDCGLGQEQITRMNQIVDNIREEMYNAILEIEITATSADG